MSTTIFAWVIALVVIMSGCCYHRQPTPEVVYSCRIIAKNVEEFRACVKM